MATGKNAQSGFSLLELIIVIALISLIGGLLIVNANAILSGLGDEPTDRTLRSAVREARYQAAALKESVRLRYDEENATFLVVSATGTELERFPTAFTNNPRDLVITFEQILPGEGTAFRDTIRKADIEAVVFRPDRSSTPFSVTIRERSQPFTLRFDPFSDIIIHDSRSR